MSYTAEEIIALSEEEKEDEEEKKTSMTLEEVLALPNKTEGDEEEKKTSMTLEEVLALPNKTKEKQVQEDISWFEEFEYAYDSTHTDVRDLGLLIQAAFPETSWEITIAGEDGLIDYKDARERHGDDFVDKMSYEERREYLRKKRDQEVQKEHENVIAFQKENGKSASAEILGNLTGTLSTPTSLFVAGKGIKGAVTTGMLLGAETEALSQAVEGELDVSDLAVATGVGAAGGLAANRIEAASRVVYGRLKVKKQEKEIQNLSDKVNEELIDGTLLKLTPKENIARARRRLSLNNSEMADLIGHNKVEFPTPDTVAKTVAARKNPIVTQNKTLKALEDYGGVLSTSIRKISKPVFGSLRKFEANQSKKIAEYTKEASDFLRLGSKLSSKFTSKSKKQKYKELETNLFNGNFAQVKTIAEENFPELLQPLDKVIGKDGILNKLHKELNEAGVKVNYLSSYFPRKVKDFKGLREKLGKETDGKLMSLLKAEAKRNKFASWKSLDNETINDVINTYLSNRAGLVGGKKSLGKKRTIETLTSDVYEEFYESAPESLNRYIMNAVKEIEKRKFFGKKNTVIGFNNKIDVEESVGNKLKEEVLKGKLSDDDVDNLKMLLSVRFNEGEQVSGSFSTTARNLQTMALLGQFDAALIQLADVGASVFMNGFSNTIRALVPAIRSKTLTSAEELGIIQNISADINANGVMSKYVDGALKYSGFRSVDRLGKDVFIEAAYQKATKLARKDPRKLTEKWGDVFGDEMPELINDLKTGKMSDNVKLLMFNELADIQPIALSEMPLKYLQHPGGRIFYSLKSFTIKQIDLMRREILDEVREGNFKKGFTNALSYAAIMGTAGASVQKVRESIQTKELRVNDFDDAVIDSLLSMFLLNRYTRERELSKGEIGTAFAGVFTPAIFNIGDEVGRTAVEQAANLVSEDAEFRTKDFEKLIAKVPIFGKLGYYWLLGGAEAKIEREEKRKERERRREAGLI